jgi:hypothetical protein
MRFTSRLPPKQVKIDADIDIDRLPEILGTGTAPVLTTAPSWKCIILEQTTYGGP